MLTTRAPLASAALLTAACSPALMMTVSAPSALTPPTTACVIALGCRSGKDHLFAARAGKPGHPLACDLNGGAQGPAGCVDRRGIARQIKGLEHGLARLRQESGLDALWSR